MKPQQIRIEIEKIRAIQSAKIILNGITVITGENGCGKSTISKLTYSLCKASIDYDDLVEQRLKSEIKKAFNPLNIIISDLSKMFDDTESKNKINILRNTLRNDKLNYDDSDVDSFVTVLDLLIEKFQSQNESNNSDYFGVDYFTSRERVKRILLSDLFPNKADEALSILQILERYKALIYKMLANATETKDNRSLEIFKEIIEDEFLDSTIIKSCNIVEYDVPIIDIERDKLLQIHSIQNVAYIDTPVSVGLERNGLPSHWKDLNRLLEKKPVFYDNVIMKNIFQENTLQGEIDLKNNEINQKLFVYKRKDGKEFNLLECATGLRSFAILQILYKNGFLNNKTLLIIDEPEAHLHPQWVVEYARLIVLLHKYIGVRFLIASHHPDMISAIKYISEKESVDSDLNFYLAKRRSNGYKYSYKNLGTDIEDIFTSFNIALERIDQYGVTE